MKPVSMLNRSEWLALNWGLMFPGDGNRGVDFVAVAVPLHRD